MKNSNKGTGAKSLAITLILVIFSMIAITTMAMGGLGINFLSKSMDESTAKYKQAMNEGYNSEIKSEVQSAIAIVQGYYDKAQSGEMTEEEAKQQAMETIRVLRYRDDNSGYMWIDDVDYNLLMHPILPEQEGNNRFDLTDQNGVKIIQNIMKSAEAGGGYNEFYFTKSDGVTVAPKVAYSEKFEPWGWVLTTGNYVDDMNATIAKTEADIEQEFKAMIITFCVVTVVILIAAFVIALLFGKKITAGIKKVEDDLRKTAEGNLSFEINGRLLKRKDEIGAIARSLDEVKNSLAGMIGNVSDAGRDLKNSSEKFSEKFDDITESIQNANRAIEELAQGATSQASETEIVNNKITELGEVINVEKEGVGRMSNSVEAMMQYSTGALESIVSLNKITEITTNAIAVVYDQTNKNNESAANINKAVEIIKGLAEQTNLLSLNASIEAARAGEAGKGFAVVAEEIRNLAEESASSAGEIEGVVRDLTENVSISSKKMDEVSTNVQEQEKRLQETREAFDHLYEEIQMVERAMKEIDGQTDVLDNLKQIVADSVNNLASVVEENAASTEETSASMQILSTAIDECTQDTRALLQLSHRQNEETSKFQL